MLLSNADITTSAPLLVGGKATNLFFLFAVGKLMELHGEGGSTTTAKVSGDDTGAKVERADGYEPPIQETV